LDLIATALVRPEDLSYGRDIAGILEDLFVADIIVSEVSKRWFDDRQILFNESQSTLSEQIKAAKELGDSYNMLLDLVYPMSHAGGGFGQRPSKIDQALVRQAAQLRGKALLDSLIQSAKAEIELGLKGHERARKILTPVVKELEVYYK
jgi:hypothetical protein